MVTNDNQARAAKIIADAFRGVLHGSADGVGKDLAARLAEEGCLAPTSATTETWGDGLEYFRGADWHITPTDEGPLLSDDNGSVEMYCFPNPESFEGLARVAIAAAEHYRKNPED